MTSPRRLSASELRSRAWDAMTATWPTVLSITGVISLTSYAATSIASALPGFLGVLLTLIVPLLLAVPQMGLVRGSLDFLRGGIFTFQHIQSMFPYAKQMICFTLWHELFIFLWSLPGLFFTAIGAGLAFAATDKGTAIAALVFLIIGLVLTVVLLVRALLNYALNICFIVDHPNMGGAAAIGKSKEMMRGHRWLYVRMFFPVLLMAAVISVIAALMAPRMDVQILSLLISLLSIAPEIMAQYIAPVLYEELNRLA